MPRYKDLDRQQKAVLVGILKHKLLTPQAIAEWLKENNADRTISQWVNLCMDVPQKVTNPLEAIKDVFPDAEYQE